MGKKKKFQINSSKDKDETNIDQLNTNGDIHTSNDVSNYKFSSKSGSLSFGGEESKTCSSIKETLLGYRRQILVFVVIVVVIIGVSIGIIVHFSRVIDTQPPEEVTVKTTQPYVISSNITLDLTWDDALEDNSSPLFLETKGTLENELVETFRSSSIGDIFKSVDVNGFRTGSVIADFTASFGAVVSHDYLVTTLINSIEERKNNISYTQTLLANAIKVEDILVKESPTPFVPTKPGIIVSNITLDLKWNDALFDNSSSLFQATKSRMEKELTDSMNKSSIRSSFKTVDVHSFGMGPILVHFTMSFKQTPSFTDIVPIIANSIEEMKANNPRTLVANIIGIGGLCEGLKNCKKDMGNG